MYFGTKQRMTTVQDAAPGAGISTVGYSDRIEYLNGGAGLRLSNGSHMEYDFSWGSITRDQLEPLEDYADSLYGDGLLYFLDPVAMDRNLFNRQWSSPKLTAEDGIPLTGTNRPVKYLINDLSLDYPMYAAQYTVVAGQAGLAFHCPIPTGYTAWIGAKGLAQAQGLRVQPTLAGVASGGATQIPVVAVTNTTRFTHSFAGGPTNGIDIKIDTIANATITLAGLMLQVLPTGVTPDTGGFIAGRGNSGCVFEARPKVTIYSLPGESLSATARLTEVGDWL